MKHQLTGEAGGARIDVFIGEKLSLSRAKVKALFEAGTVKVNGRRAKKGDEVVAGSTIDVEVDETGPRLTADTQLALTVLWEDESLAFIDKPARVPSHPLAPGELGTVANALMAKYPGIEAVGDDVREAGLCHRLDVETSGVLLAAKTRSAWEAMRQAFSGDARTLDKRYLALVRGPIADEGMIELPLAQHGDHVRPQLDGVDGAAGREAKSEFWVKQRMGSTSLVEVRIFTGVMHQVRAHLAAIGAPIVGDTMYGGAQVPGLDRFFLHACSLTVTHPVSGKTVRVESPLPAQLAMVLETLSA